MCGKSLRILGKWAIGSAVVLAGWEVAVAGEPVSWRDNAPFFRQGLEAAESFRQSLLRPDQDGIVRGEFVAEAIQRFPEACRRALGDRPNLDGFDVTAQSFLRQIRGQTRVDPAQAFAAFEGAWYGQWDRMRVDHQWDPTRVFHPPQHVAPGLPTLEASQYAWVGDAFCWNYVVVPAGRPEGNVLLGMVYHVDPADVTRITRRRPHVGSYVAEGKLIWLTAGEIFFEHVLPPRPEEGARYVITGFFYRIADGRLENRGDGFQAIYTRHRNQRPPWFRFPLRIRVR